MVPTTAPPPSTSSLHTESTRSVGRRCPRGGPRPGGNAMRDLPAMTTWPSGRITGAIDMSTSAALSAAQVGRGEELQEMEGRGELEHRVAVVIGVGGRGNRSIAHADPDVAILVDDRRGTTHPHRTLRLAGTDVEPVVVRRSSGFIDGHYPSPIAAAVAVISPESEYHLTVCRGSDPSAATARWVNAPAGSTSSDSSSLPDDVLSPTSVCRGRPATNSSATAKISPREGRRPASR